MAQTYDINFKNSLVKKLLKLYLSLKKIILTIWIQLILFSTSWINDSFDFAPHSYIHFNYF